MQVSSLIQYLENKQIDKALWDECMKQSTNRLIYGRAFYLDNMAVQWGALIGENYDWVFPITHKRKYGITYLYQPPLCQQLGVFAKPNVIIPIQAILEWLKKHYRFWEINCNYATDNHFLLSPLKVSIATNFTINLSDNYRDISAKYDSDLVKNLRRSKKLELTYRTTSDYNKVIQLFIKYYANRLSNITARDYNNFGNVCAYAKERDNLIIREVVNSQNDLMSIVLILQDGKRLYNLMNVTTEPGRRAEANHLLIDSIIKEYSGKDLIFDFEGSDVPGVRKFYQNFGGENQPFFLVKYNALPWPLRQLKE